MEGIFAPNGWLIQGLILATGVIGQLYVARMNLKGFYYWAVSNVLLVTVSLQVGGYGMVALYAYFLFMAIYSLLHWKERQEQDRRRQQQYGDLLVIAEVFVSFARIPEILHATNGSLDAGTHLERAKAILLAEGRLVYDEVHPRRHLPEIEPNGVRVDTAHACACADN